MKTDEMQIERYARRPMPSLRDLVAVLFRQRLAMATAFAVVLLAVAVSGMLVPKYQARMKILVERQRQDAVITSSVNAPVQIDNTQITEEDLNSEVELLNSEDLVRKVVLETLLSDTANPSETKIAAAVRKLGQDLEIEPLRQSAVISVKYANRDPQMAAKVLQALSAEYTEKHLEVHRASGEFKFFDQQAEQYRQGLQKAQEELTDFTKGSGVVSADTERDAALQQASEFDANANQAHAAVHETEQRVVALQAQLQALQPRMTTVVRTSDNPQLFEQLKSTLLNLQIKRTELLTKYEPTYRLVQEVDQQIADAQSAISAEEKNPMREETTDQDPDYQWIREELTKAQADLSGLKARATATSAVAGQYHETARRLGKEGVVQQNLVQAAKTQEDNYLLYVRKREEARISDALDRGGILDVAMAQQPTVPALPKRSPLASAMLALLLAGTVSVSTAFVLDLMDPSFRTPDELATYLGAPVLAALPKGGE